MTNFIKRIDVLAAPVTYLVKQEGYTQSGYAGTVDRIFYARGRYAKGYAIPNFKKRKKAGELLPHTPWQQGEAQEFEITPGRWFTRHVSNPAVFAEWDPYVEHLPTGFTPPDVDLTPATYSLQKAASEIYSQGLDALTFAAELPKTGQMITDFGKKLQNLSRGLSRKRILSAWLEGRYGWRTLAYDARDIYHAVAEMDHKREVWSERQGLSLKRTITDSQPLVSATNNTAYLNSSIELSESIRGSISARISVSRFRLNPLETLWELVPLSFVLDWVYDVGTAIRALSFSAVQTGHYASIGYRQDYVASYDTEFDTDLDNRQDGEWTGACKFTGSRVLRQPTSINYSPQVTNRLLSPDLALDLTAIAETRNLISSRR